MSDLKNIVLWAGFWVCLFLCSSLQTAGQVYDEIRTHAYNAEFEQAAEKFFQSGTNDWRSAYFYMWSESLRATLSGDPASIDTHELEFSGIRRHIDSLRTSPEQKLFLETEWYLHQALIRGRYEKELEALFLFRQAMIHLRDGLTRYPSYLPFRKTSGMMNLMLGSIPDNYQWLLQLLGWGGTIEKGMSELATTFVDPDFGLEARLYYHLVQAYLVEEISKGYGGMEDLYEIQPSEFNRFMLIAVASKASDGKRVIELGSSEKSQLWQIEYFTGEAYLQKSEYDSALNYLQRFLDTNPGYELVKDAHLKMGLCYRWKGDMEGANNQFELARREGNILLESDNNASRLIKGEFNDHLLKCRLATDGGFYKLAKTYLADFYQSGEGDTNPELLKVAKYRESRIWHKQGSLEKAKTGYRDVLADSDFSSNSYFYPNSSLLLGKILVDEGNFEEARKRLKEVLKYKGHEYKRSLDHKARALLSYIDSIQKQ